MPQQLIYTSAPQGIVAGRSGHCTVARSAKMREPLMLQLEKFCYYQHLSLTGGQERPIYSCRIVDIRGTRFHVLSRIQDAGLDFTGRTNFIAHHLVFTPEEIRQFPTPPVILREWPGWVKSWTKDPQMLEKEDWADLTAFAGRSSVPAQTWQRVTGDAVNGYGLLEARAGASFRVDDQADETVLELIAESLELLEVRDTRRDFHTTAWNYTFTTSMQEQDNPADFRWRCIHSDNPAANRFATPDCRALSAVQATKLTSEETNFARTGRQPPKFVKLAADNYDIQEGAGVKLEVATDGIPTPTIRWFEIERNQPKEMVGKSGTIQILNPEGRSKRYQVQAFNSAGSVDSNVVEISIRAPVKLATRNQTTASRVTATPVLDNEDYQEKKERQLRRLEAEKEKEIIQHKRLRNTILLTILTIGLIAGALYYMFVLRERKPPEIILQPTIQTSDGDPIRIRVANIGKKPFSYQWYKGDKLILSTTNSDLALERNTLSNSASFFVIITNFIGSVTSTVAQWPGIPAPIITLPPTTNPPAETKTNHSARLPLEDSDFNSSTNGNTGTNQSKLNLKGKTAPKKP